MDAASPAIPGSLSNLQTQQQAEAYFVQGNYAEAVEFYTAAITEHPTEIRLYGYLGLALLLQGEEIEAQSTWMVPILGSESDEEQTRHTVELLKILQAEADHQAENTNYESAWLIRQHLRELVPENLDNLLCVIQLALQANFFLLEDELLGQVIEALKLPSGEIPDLSHIEVKEKEKKSEQLLKIAHLLLDLNPSHSTVIQFLKVCIPYWFSSSLASNAITLLLHKASECYGQSLHQAAAHLAQLCVMLAPDNINLLFKVLHIIQHGDLECLQESIKLAERCIALSTRLVDRIIAINALLASWIYSGGRWQRAVEIFQDFQASLFQLVQAQSELTESELDLGFLSGLLPLGGLAFYFEDDPRTNRTLRNQMAQMAQQHLQAILKPDFERYQGTNLCHRSQVTKISRPRIGYLAGSFRQHSVGWLCRWLLQYHDRNHFDIHLYSSRRSNDFIQQKLKGDYGDRFHSVPSTVSEIANQIHDDGINILIELDSLTSLGGCGVVALKPAPIQVHWLGYDSSGIPSVDYFIADPYVLPEDAQDYYSETIWRLPHSYIAVDGFEVHLPSLRRDQLDIPGDAVVYLSSQTGMKRNIDNARLQLRILKEVPNSFFLIKSFRAIPELIENFFKELAEAEGVNVDRLRFLPDVPSEFTHRANLALADIVLDTYPYNGATTTLEALWMGLPIVTRVGQQFAARNSYTMMMNVGITEGLAWTDEEYLEWGVRLGTDANLRQNIFCRLQQSRHHSPLWNGRQFAREMEKAYEQMWQVFLDQR